MLGRFIRPYLERFCNAVSVEELVSMVDKGEDVYPEWIKQFGDSERPPAFAVFFRGDIISEVRKQMAEVSPQHFRVFEANPSWAERQLDGLMRELL